jgi:hypothetical protein
MAKTFAQIANAHGQTWLRIDRDARSQTVLLRMGAIESVSYEKRVLAGVFEVVLEICLSDQAKWKFTGDEAKAAACALGIEIGEEAGEDDPRQAMWRDTIRSALMALGPATVDDIEAHLRECGITRPRSLISTTLGQLRNMGQVEKRGEQWALNRAAR